MKKSMIIANTLTVMIAASTMFCAMPAKVQAVSYGRPASYSAQASMPFRPTSCIGNYRLISSGFVNQNIAQAVYDNGGKRLTVRKARGSTGMRSTYPRTVRTYYDGLSILLTGNNNGFYTAEWSRNGYSYSMSSNTPIDQTMMCRYITAATNA